MWMTDPSGVGSNSVVWRKLTVPKGVGIVFRRVK
jgi:hypothetical protein